MQKADRRQRDERSQGVPSPIESRRRGVPYRSLDGNVIGLVQAPEPHVDLKQGLISPDSRVRGIIAPSTTSPLYRLGIRQFEVGGVGMLPGDLEAQRCRMSVDPVSRVAKGWKLSRSVPNDMC